MVMFCDLVGSTELSGRHEPERYGLLIERYVSEVRATLEGRYGGQVVGVQGDGLLALFGAPDAHGDDAERAVRAALEVIDAVRALSADTQRDFGEKLAVRIAIHRGQIYRDLESVYGLTTNVTARLQQLAPPDGIVISDDVQRMIGGVFETDSMGPHLVKGVDEPILAHQVVGERSDFSSPPQFPAPPSSTGSLNGSGCRPCGTRSAPAGGTTRRPFCSRGRPGWESRTSPRGSRLGRRRARSSRRARRIGLLRRLGPPPGAETHRIRLGRSQQHRRL